jgi:hypothetical protein
MRPMSLPLVYATSIPSLDLGQFSTKTNLTLGFPRRIRDYLFDLKRDLMFVFKKDPSLSLGDRSPGSGTKHEPVALGSLYGVIN